MAEKTLDQNNAGTESAAGTGQPAKETPAPEVTPETVEAEIDATLAAKGDEDKDAEVKDGAEGTVVLKKEEYQRILVRKDQFKAGLLSAKDKIKGFKKAAAPVAATTPAGQGAAEKPVTVSVLNERQAIKDLTAADPLLDANWDDVVKNFTGKRGRGSVENIVEDIQDAFTIWKARNPEKVKAAQDAAGAAGDVTTDRSKPGAGTSGTGKPQEGRKGGVLPSRTPVSGWYPKKDK